jgi:hypothetical protein
MALQGGGEGWIPRLEENKDARTESERTGDNQGRQTRRGEESRRLSFAGTRKSGKIRLCQKRKRERKGEQDTWQSICHLQLH